MINHPEKLYILSIWWRNPEGTSEFLVDALVTTPFTKDGILDHYAENYAFDRKKLTAYVQQVIDLTDVHV